MGRRLLLLCLGALPGCAAIGAPGAPLVAIPAAVGGLSLRAFGRTPGDAVVSLLTGEDCSIARIGRGEAYCDRDAPPAPPPICTRSLGGVDCWTTPPAAWPAHRGIADGPATLSAAQENNRIGWTGRIARAMAGPDPQPAATAAVALPAAAVPPVPIIEPAPPRLPPAAAEAAREPADTPARPPAGDRGMPP